MDQHEKILASPEETGAIDLRAEHDLADRAQDIYFDDDRMEEAITDALVTGLVDGFKPALRGIRDGDVIPMKLWLHSVAMAQAQYEMENEYENDRND